MLEWSSQLSAGTTKTYSFLVLITATGEKQNNGIVSLKKIWISSKRFAKKR